MLRERRGPPRLLEGGEGEVLVSLHGGGGLHHDPALALLSEEFRVIAPELGGFAPGAVAPESFGELAQEVLGVLDAEGVKTCTLAGTSFGAVVALHAALVAPERLEALVLLSPAVFVPPGRTPPLDIERALFAREGGPRPQPAPPELARQRHALLEAMLGAIDEDALRERLPALEVPTLVVCGTQDGLFGSAHGHVFRELMPNCSSVLLYGAAHELGWDRPEALAELVGDFARRREAFVVSS